MAGFEERFEYFKDITNRCLQYALECGYIKINDDLYIFRSIPVHFPAAYKA